MSTMGPPLPLVLVGGKNGTTNNGGSTPVWNRGRGRRPADAAGQLGEYMIHAGVNTRQKKRQQRTERWQKETAFQKLRESVKGFVQESKKTATRYEPTNAELMAHVDREYNHDRKEDKKKRLCKKAGAVVAPRRRQEAVVSDMLKDIVHGGHGIVPVGGGWIRRQGRGWRRDG